MIISTRLAGDGLWICEASEGPHVDALRHTRVPGSRNHSEQSTTILFWSGVCRTRMCIWASSLEQVVVNSAACPHPEGRWI